MTIRRGVVRALALVTALALPLSLTSPAQAAGGLDEVFAKLLVKQVKGANVSKHLKAFQAIADANGGNRAAGTSGYDASRDYVADKLRKAGYKVTLQPIDFVAGWVENSPPVLADYTPNEDFFTFQPSPAGDVTAPVQGVDLTLPPAPTPTSTSGCEMADFAGFTAGNIALIQRGTCPFATKVRNAGFAGASAIIVFNEGQPGRTEANPLDIGEWRAGIPMIYADFAVGNALATTATPVRLAVDATLTLGTNDNVIAESRWGDSRDVVMVGAHLDSVPEGPGINDNASGSAAILETALQMRHFPVKNKVRFAFWAAEEIGLLGSDQYVESLTQAQRDRIRVYLNFDMVASPNYGLFLYDGDDSDATGAPAGPPGSAQIEARLEKFFKDRKVPTRGTDFDGRSDYGPFIAVGIPSGGIFTGAEGIKTPDEAALWGGTAGQAYDPCYHLACDTLTNVNAFALDVNSDAIADSTARYAFDLRTIPDRPAGARAALSSATAQN
ncbi:MULTISPECIES: M28 family metallopeptidase [Nonomuraea]|uniref:M28 family metallopeptidase n=1 Tax=Nonomuraea ferruginea TaxID=46174 RepID=A0ABT4T3J8_9ACTN|nr:MULTISPECIES: M28 family metallopeptidase [Nonomuraea]MDA0643994.1 M28 family metallopeptidase [Nonomuraea ferruginea]TXK43213.1 M20/M25/M40 family metallo-hydrolase [Nonomuraea sp. C10]